MMESTGVQDNRKGTRGSAESPSSILILLVLHGSPVALLSSAMRHERERARQACSEHCPVFLTRNFVANPLCWIYNGRQIEASHLIAVHLHDLLFSVSSSPCVQKEKNS